MNPSTASVSLSRTTGFLGGAASLDGVTYVAITDATYTGTELVAIRRRGETGEHVAALPFVQVTGVVACGSTLLVAGSSSDSLGAAIVSPNGNVIQRRWLGADSSSIAPLCEHSEASLIWRSRERPSRIAITDVKTGRERDVLDETQLITFGAASADANTMILTRVHEGLRTQAPGGPSRALRDSSLDMPVICASGDAFVAAWSEDHAQTVRAQRLDADGEPRGRVVDVARTKPGEEIRSVHLACQSDRRGRFAVFWQTATLFTDPLPGDRTSPRLWVSFGDDHAVRAPVELPEGGPGVAAWRGDELVVVHGGTTPTITTLAWPE